MPNHHYPPHDEVNPMTGAELRYRELREEVEGLKKQTAEQQAELEKLRPKPVKYTKIVWLENPPCDTETTFFGGKHGVPFFWRKYPGAKHKVRLTIEYLGEEKMTKKEQAFVDALEWLENEMYDVKHNKRQGTIRVPLETKDVPDVLENLVEGLGFWLTSANFTGERVVLTFLYPKGEGLTHD